MPKPITPLVGCDVFVLNDRKQVLLIKRADNGLWAMPGGCHDLGETPKKCAERECFEETGYNVKCTDLLGIYSSTNYEYKTYPWKENEFTHILFKADLIDGSPTTSSETIDIGWFSKDQMPPLSDGHDIRLNFCWKFAEGKVTMPYFE